MKQTFLALMLLFAMNTVVMAQDNNQERRRPDRKEMISMRTDRMAERYGLDEAQKAKLMSLNTQFADSMNFNGFRGPRGDFRRGEGNFERRNNNGGEQPNREMMEEMRKKMEASQQAYEAELKKIMSEEQFAKYSEDRKQMRQGRPGMGGNGPRGRRPMRQNEE